MFGLLDPTTEIALFIGVMSGITILLIGAALAGGASRQFTRRLQDVAAHKTPTTDGRSNTPLRSLSRRGSATPGIDRIFRMLPRREALVERLGKTGYQISVGQYMLATGGAIVAVTFLALVFAKLNLMASALFGIAIGAFIPHFFIGRAGKQRVARFIGLFPEAIDMIVRALRAGLPITEAMVNASQEIGDPVGAEFRGIEAGMRLGRDLDSLLWDIARRIPAPEFRFFIIALSVQRETGGNLAETLNNLSEVLRRRRTMRAKARAMASEARASTMILGSLPFIVAAILSITSPAYIMPLFTDVRGLVMVGVGIAMLVIGVTVMVKMARFEI